MLGSGHKSKAGVLAALPLLEDNLLPISKGCIRIPGNTGSSISNQSPKEHSRTSLAQGSEHLVSHLLVSAWETESALDGMSFYIDPKNLRLGHSWAHSLEFPIVRVNWTERLEV